MYIDTSVAVKLYVNEPDSRDCEAVVRGASVASSYLLYGEFRSALHGKVQRGAISPEVCADVWRQFQNEVESKSLTLISIDDTLVEDAAELIAELPPRFPLRTLDALHLATCLRVEAGPLFSKDTRMLRAAATLGIPVVN